MLVDDVSALFAAVPRAKQAATGRALEAESVCAPVLKTAAKDGELAEGKSYIFAADKEARLRFKPRAEGGGLEIEDRGMSWGA